MLKSFRQNCSDARPTTSAASNAMPLVEEGDEDKGINLMNNYGDEEEELDDFNDDEQVRGFRPKVRFGDDEVTILSY